MHKPESLPGQASEAGASASGENPGLAATLAELRDHREFSRRHIGPSLAEQEQMLASLGLASLEELVEQVVPATIRSGAALSLEDGYPEADALAQLRAVARRNKPFKSFIGQGYYGCYTPSVIRRNILENPAWYTAYTPYQPEISQGRLEAMLNFQTMVMDLTGMDLANASLLDEATAAAEAMTLCKRSAKVKSNVFFVAADCLPQTIDVLRTRAAPLGFELITGDPDTDLDELECFGALLQYPGVDGEVRDYRETIGTLHARKALVVMAADLLSLLLLKSPGELGADVVIGSSQRFGIPFGFGGPHAAYMATRDALKRGMPGRLVGVSVDSQGNPAYRLALQTREQHIRREKATSNICTAQVLLAVMASMYAVYHGPAGLRRIALRVFRLTNVLASGLQRLGIPATAATSFDTLTVDCGASSAAILERATRQGANLRRAGEQRLGIALDETTTPADIAMLWQIFNGDAPVAFTVADQEPQADARIPQSLLRSDPVLSHPVFNRYHSETEMMRYLRRLADRDIALDRAMIPLGSCTMKLNAAAEMIPVTWDEFANIHPFAPADQVQGYRQLISELEQMLCEVTGYAAVSLQPNAGSQGEYAGLLAIRAYHESRGEGHRNICLIPMSAHGTNPASAQMCAMQVVVVECDREGNVDLADLRDKARQHAANLAAVMVTYPSTHGVFEAGINEVCDIVHRHGGQVYIDGANLNAMVGVCQPGQFGGDVSHLNLHKTFCIPHGGGGPGVGPVAVGAHLAPFLPGHASLGDTRFPVGPVSAAAFGSAGILPISWMYIKMMGAAGLRTATEVAILSANYIAQRLKPHFPVLYSGAGGRVAHECIIDLRPIREETGISVDDVAKRLIDYGFHAPTMSFPVAGTLMIEPTESESLAELDRFCEAMIGIREEIRQLADGSADEADNVLRGAPHTAAVVTADEWPHPYSRSQAAYPAAGLRDSKYWPPVGRVDNVFGDRNLVCSCPAIADYRQAEAEPGPHGE